MTAYAVLRPDGAWSLLLVNKDYEQPQDLCVVFHDDEAKTDFSFDGSVEMITFGKAQYQWHPAGKQGHADPDGPAAKSTVRGGKDWGIRCRLRR